MREFLALYFQVSTPAWLLSMAWCSADGSVRLSFCLCNTQEKVRVREAPRHYALALGLPYPSRGLVCPRTQGYLLKLLLSLVEPSMACPALLLGHLHDLLEGGIVLACVLAQEDIQAGQRLLLLLLSSFSCSEVQMEWHRNINSKNTTWQSVGPSNCTAL